MTNPRDEDTARTQADGRLAGMPVGRLRDAAAAIREDHGEPFWRALAEWLDREALLHETAAQLADLVQAAAQTVTPNTKVMLNWGIDDSDGREKVAGTTFPQAIAVAEAYLDGHSGLSRRPSQLN